ncbi:4453_t:CDS:1 [Acaulospora morrowiae]|uniref:4453_t:CDS:1 n=1 Tax=Acaulospora morrowiae TaxID=94023 RepID=A0A9N9F1Y7_9GLOM|nr:4453_t:CDS:1 [Acaulospora morrowiae]
MILGPNTAKDPDSMVQPVRRPRPPPAQAMDRRGMAYPTMVIEVDHMQTLLDLHRKVALYFNPRTTIKIVLAVKLNEPRMDNTIAIIVALYLRTSPTPLIPVDVRSFGTAPPSHSHKNHIYNIMCVPPHLFTGVGLSDANNNPFPPCARAGIPDYQMNIPATELFNGDPTGVPASAVGGFNLDLWELQLVARQEFNLP